MFNFFQLGFSVGALVVRGLGDGARVKGITPITHRRPGRESLPGYLDRCLKGNRSRKLSGISPEVWPAPESLQR